MPGRRGLLIAGAATFVLGLVILFPARVAWHWLAPPGAALAGIDGSVWHGSAREASAGGLYLRDLRWRWQPSGLLAGRVSWSVEAGAGGGTVAGRIGVAPTGRVHIADLAGALPLALLEPAVGVAGLAGTARVEFAELTFADGLPERATGSVEVSGLVVPVIAPGPLGRYRAEFQNQEDGIVAVVRDDGGAVDLAGRLQIGADRAYDFLGYVAPNENTPNSLQRQLQFLGTPNAEGQHELRLSGRY